MKKMMIPFLACLITFAGVAYYFISNSSPENKRKKYESFLLSQASTYSLAYTASGDKPFTGSPDLAAMQNFLMTADPALERVPQERLLAAFQATENLRLQKGGFSTLHWQSIPSDLGGRTRAVMWDPNDTQHKKVWAGGVTGGLWYNPDITNPGSTWIPVSDLWNCLAIQCITSDPNDPKVFYAGTGEYETAMPQYRSSSGLGNGIWKSTDGGQTWNHLSSTSGFAYISDLVIRDEGTASTIYAGVVSGQYQGDHHSDPSEGLFRSADGGNTWEQVLPNIPGFSVPFAPSDLDITSDNSHILAGTKPNIYGQGGATILRSEDGSPGSWTIDESIKDRIENEDDSFNIPGRVVLACAPSDPNVVYALAGAGDIDDSTNFVAFWCTHIVRSADKGETWFEKSLPLEIQPLLPNFAYLAWHALTIGIDPNNANTVYIGGLDVHKTYNGGGYWHRVSDWSLVHTGGGNRYLHGDHHIISFRPGSSDEILFGTDGGVFYTVTGTLDEPVFLERNHNFNTLQFYTCAINPEAGSLKALGGLQDMLSLYYTGAPLTMFDLKGGGDGSSCFFDKDEPKYFITSINDNAFVVYDNGVPVNSIFDYYHKGIFINPADYDSRTNSIYANSVDFISTLPDVYIQIDNVTTPGGYSPMRKSANTGAAVYFSAVSVSPNSPYGETTLYLGTVSGQLFRLNHAESTPVATEITGDDFPAGNISSIAVGSSDDTLLVTFSNYGVVSVWISCDGGQSWTDKEGNLPDMPVRWAILYPGHSADVLLATETGVWSTSGLYQPEVIWAPDLDGMPNVRTDMLDFRKSDHTVLAGTHGRGFYTAVWDPLDVDVPDEQSWTLFPNPTTGPVFMEGGDAYQEMTIRIMDHSGRLISQKILHPGSGSSTFVSDLSETAGGVYIIAAEAEGKMPAAKRIVKY